MKQNRHSGGTGEYSGNEFRGGDRRVNFKPGGNRHGGRFIKDKNWSKGIASHLEEEDIDMNVRGTNFKGKKGNRKSGQGPPAPIERRLMQNPTGWYRITIPYGNKYDKNYLLKLLVEMVAPLTFWPICWSASGNTITFFVEDRKVAEKLLASDRKVQLPNGFKLILKVNPGTPNVDMTNEVKEKIKLVMAKRYNLANKALDLTKFHSDPDLQEYFCALFKPIVFDTVLKIIQEENIQDLEALCLNENKLTVFGFLKRISKDLPNIKILHLANNRIKDLIQLDAFIGLPIVDLLLDGNPLCDKFKEQSTYIRYNFQVF